VGDSAGDALDVFVVAPIGGGPFPAIVFNHGYGSNAQAYSSFLDDFARHGFVVAGPNFTSNDIAQDASAVRRTVDWLTSSPSELAPAHINRHGIAVMGHSLGGLTALAVAYNSCCRDRRIAAAIAIESPVGDLPNGTYEWSTPPLLIVLGDNDPLVPATTGPQLLSKFAGTAYLLTIPRGGHGGGMDATDPAHTAVLRTELDFLNAYLSHDPQSLRALAHDANGSHTVLHTHEP
jgi:dienelactone hydrolase